MSSYPSTQESNKHGALGGNGKIVDCRCGANCDDQSAVPTPLPVPTHGANQDGLAGSPLPTTRRTDATLGGPLARSVEGPAHAPELLRLLAPESKGLHHIAQCHQPCLCELARTHPGIGTWLLPPPPSCSLSGSPPIHAARLLKEANLHPWPSLRSSHAVAVGELPKFFPWSLMLEMW